MLRNLVKPTGIKISVIITFIFLVLFLRNLMYLGSGSFIELIDKKIVDTIIRARGNTLETDYVAIAAIDPKSVDNYGRWPWGRDMMAKLLHELESYYQIKVLGYDVLFSETDSADITAQKVINQYHLAIQREMRRSGVSNSNINQIHAEISSKFSNDAKFGAELSKWDNVVMGYFFYMGANIDQIKHLTEGQIAESDRQIENSEITIIQGADFLSDLFVYEGQVAETNISTLITNKSMSGFFNTIPDREDGTIRRVPLVIRYKDAYYPSLDLQIIRRYYGDPPIRMVVNEGGLESIIVGKKEIFTSSDGQVMVNYKGPAFTFPHYSVYDIIEHNIPREKLQGKIVLLGATDTGAFDLRTTPVGSSYPGVEVHANLLDNILNDDYFYRSDFVELVTFLLILLFGLVMGIFLPKFRPLPGAIFSISILAGFIAINLWFFMTQRTWVSFFYIIGVIVFNWSGIILFKFFGEEKDKRFIKGAFQQYLSPKVIDKLVDDPSMLRLGGEKKEITAFFSDVQGFSTISESLSPEELVELLNEYLTAMTDIIMKYDGTVDKFEGDAVIAFFGAPIAYDDHALRACLASLEMQEKMMEMRKAWREQGKHELYVRIGLNTGDCVVGNMGSAYRMDYTMMGDSVNLASRLEGVNKQYHTYCLISEYTQKAIKDSIEVRELDLIRVVGKNEPIRIFEVLGRKGDLSPETLKAYKFFGKGLQLYRQQQWDEAKKYFAHSNKLLGNDGASKVFFDRCKEFQKNPPAPGWDGVYQMATK